MPSNINSVIKNKIKKKNYFRPTDPNFFSACDSKHTYFFCWPNSETNTEQSNIKNEHNNEQHV